jgi:hypothetical protein|tara:strand:+ start:4026 stop:4811 length:786 start_codon:yes stop_codon:yes gene_type:complete
MTRTKQNIVLNILVMGCFVFIAGCAKTDDVDIPIPKDPNEGYTFQIPDRAFGEYMVYRGIPGVQQRVDTLDSGTLQTNFYMNPDLVVGVNALSLSKTSSNVSALEAAGVVTASQKIQDLSGVEFFTGLDTLIVTSNDLVSLDLTANTDLVELSMNFCKVESLDLSACPNLKKLRFRGSSQANELLSEIDLSNNLQLRHLHLRSHGFVSIDLSANTMLVEEVDMSENPGPDGNTGTSDITIPTALFEQIQAAGGVLLGVIPG